MKNSTLKPFLKKPSVSDQKALTKAHWESLKEETLKIAENRGYLLDERYQFLLNSTASTETQLKKLSILSRVDVEREFPSK